MDRQYRMAAWERNQKKYKRYGHHSADDILVPNYYWKSEAPVFNEELLAQILAETNIDTVVTHTAPSFCELQDKSGLDEWAAYDSNLIPDIQDERSTMDSIHAKLKGCNIGHWCYGHFHQSWHASIEGILFKMLDITELYEVR